MLNTVGPQRPRAGEFGVWQLPDQHHTHPIHSVRTAKGGWSRSRKSKRHRPAYVSFVVVAASCFFGPIGARDKLPGRNQGTFAFGKAFDLV